MSLYRFYKKDPRSKPLTNKCIILDLDETLVHSSEDYEDFNKLGLFSDPNLFNIRRRFYSFPLASYDQPSTIWGVTRPRLEEFIPFCYDYFAKVCVWSAGSPDYVDKIVKRIFPPGYEPHLIYHRNHCHYSRDGEIFKPLDKMIRDSKLDKIMKPENTFFVDDRSLAFIKNPSNGIVIPAYSPKSNIDELDQDDTCLDDLMTWLRRPEVMNSSDVRLLNKEGIFN